MKGTPFTIFLSFLTCFIVISVLVFAPFFDACALELNDPNLVGVWLFDEEKGEKAKDESQYENDGKVINAEWVEGQFGTALKFNGTDAYVEIPHSKSVDFAGKTEISIMCWINITGVGVNWGRIVDKSPVNRSYTMTKYGGEDAVLWRPITGALIDIKSSPLKQNQWYHIAATYDGKESRFYLNGELDQKQTFGGQLGVAEMSLVIGGQTGALEGGGNPSWFDGMIDEVLIYNGVPSEDDIKEAWTKGLSSMLGVEKSGKLAITWGKIKRL